MSSLNWDCRYRAENRQGSHGRWYMPCCVVVSRVKMARRLCTRERLVPITSEQGSHARLARYRKAAMAALIGHNRRWHGAARCGVASLACDIPVHITALASLDTTGLRSSYLLALEPIGLRHRRKPVFSSNARPLLLSIM